MPQPFNNAVMTNAGAALLTKAQAGQCNIEFTKMAIGDGQYTAEEETVAALQERTKLKSQRNDYKVNKCEIYTEKSVRVTAAISNYDPASGESVIDEGYYINEIGLFGKEKDGDSSTEVLYSIATVAADEGDFMPAYNGYNPATITQEYYATVDNSAEVYVDVSGAYATMDEVEEAVKTVESTVSDAFDATKAYSAGDYCIYNDTLYKFTADKGIGAWDDSVVEKTTATAEIQSNTDLIDKLDSDSWKLRYPTQCNTESTGINIDVLFTASTDESSNAGVYWANATYCSGDQPWTSGYYYILSFANLQFAFRLSSNGMKYRIRSNGEWINWFTII